jgi:hypothetical protein
MLAPVIVGNVKSGTFSDCGVESDGLQELQFTAITTIATTAIIRIAIIINRVFDILLAILVTSLHKPDEIFQVTGQHQNSHADKQYRGYYGGDEGMAAKPSDVSGCCP